MKWFYSIVNSALAILAVLAIIFRSPSEKIIPLNISQFYPIIVFVCTAAGILIMRKGRAIIAILLSILISLVLAVATTMFGIFLLGARLAHWPALMTFVFIGV